MTKRGGQKISPTLCASNMPTPPLHTKYAAGAFYFFRYAMIVVT
jgi:hypothetical protein